MLGASQFLVPAARVQQIHGGALADGEHRASLVAEDVYGNKSQPAEFRFVLDTTPPAAASRPDLMDSSDSGASSDDNLTNLATIMLSVDIGLARQVAMLVDGQTAKQVSAQRQASLAIDSLTHGTHTLQAIAIDEAGNTSDVSACVEITLDLQPPFEPTWTVAEPAPGCGPRERLGPDRGAGQRRAAARRSARPPCRRPRRRQTRPARSSLLDVPVAAGDNVLRVVATDAAGNTSESVQTFASVVPDVSPPSIRLQLSQDTGTSSADLLTNNPTVVGSIADASPIASVQVSVGTSAFADALGWLRRAR